jgi:hypothetical protein
MAILSMSSPRTNNNDPVYLYKVKNPYFGMSFKHADQTAVSVILARHNYLQQWFYDPTE